MENCIKKIMSRHKLKIVKQDTGAIIFDKVTGEYFQTNEVGKYICEMYVSGLSIEQIAINISKNYDISLATATEDVTTFLNEFINLR